MNTAVGWLWLHAAAELRGRLRRPEEAVAFFGISRGSLAEATSALLRPRTHDRLNLAPASFQPRSRHRHNEPALDPFGDHQVPP
jgi:hypothetical protein